MAGFNLFNELSEVMSDTKKFGFNKAPHMSPTGLDCFDYLNGTCIVDDEGRRNFQVGLDDGKIG